jgi:hypothetical protein
VATLAELRQKWATGATKPEPGEKPLPSGVVDMTGPTPTGPDWIWWSDKEVLGWARRVDVISHGAIDHGQMIHDARFKNGRFAGKTIRMAAETNGRGYLRWWYSQMKESPGTTGMLKLVRQVLGEDDEVIRQKAQAED